MTNKFFTLIMCTTVFSLISCGNNDEPLEPIKIVIEGASIAPKVGGPNEPNQVYVDLSTNTSTPIRRDTWDLGFYSGTDFRVTINGSVFMAVAQLSETNIDAVNSATIEVVDLKPKVAVGTFDADNIDYIDSRVGDITDTAISEISAIDSENKVYLVNLGLEVGSTTPPVGSVAISGDPRGWKKIRILRKGNAYVLQYAELDETTHTEVEIFKNVSYSFSYFSFDTGNEIGIAPEKAEWDLNFTVFTNEFPNFGSYGYSDFVVNNTKSDVKVYMIDTDVDSFTYDAYSIIDVDITRFTDEQRGIGSSWRNGGGPGSLPSLKDNVFYIVNDTDGNLYKLKFLALTNQAGERGHPEFVYSLLK